MRGGEGGTLLTLIILQREDSSKGLNDFFDTSNYPVPTSHVEALLIFDHQVRMQFVLIESAYKVRQAIFDSQKTSSKKDPGNLNKLLKELTETIVSELLFKEEFPFFKFHLYKFGFDLYNEIK